MRTLFQTLALRDDLVLTERGSGGVEIEVVGAELPVENTLTKTLRLVRELVDLPPLHVHLTKRIPSQAGLGGGSSDAAGLLRGLTALGYALPWDQAEAVAVAVGADVPFFLVGGLARGEGYGERLTPLPDPPTEAMVVVLPDARVSTPEAYAALDRLPNRPWAPFPEGSHWNPYNDFERVAPCVCGDVAERLQGFGASSALLSGSGSSVFGVFSEPERAEEAAIRARQEHLGEVWLTTTLGRADALAVTVERA